MQRVCCTVALAALLIAGGHSAVAETLDQASAAYARSTSSGSADSIVAYFDPDVVVMSPQSRSGPVRGIEANRAAWQKFFSAKNPSHAMTSDTVVVAKGGDMGYTLGHWTVGMDTPDGRAEAAGQWLGVWRRTAGHWRITAITAYTFR